VERHPGQTSYAPERFTPEDYQRVMAGKPRYAGAQAALEHFGVPDAERRALEYGDRKQVMIVELIEASQFHAYPDALRFVLAVKDAGLRIAAASSSKNANAFLERIRLDEFVEEEDLSYGFVEPGYTLLDILDANVSGRDFEQGKPHPEIFLTAGEELAVPPVESFVGGKSGVEENPGAWLGAAMGELANSVGRDKLTLVGDPIFAPLGVWIEQLAAESTGKKGKGIVPVESEPPGAPEVYGDDRLFVYTGADGSDGGGSAGKLEELARAGHPVVRI
jgi:beta-phosphoglucomutase-like phosphatase (HAD superfamily)